MEQIWLHEIVSNSIIVRISLILVWYDFVTYLYQMGELAVQMA